MQELFLQEKNFAEWALEWLNKKNNTVKNNTFNATYYNTIMNHLIPEFGDKNLNELTELQIQKFITDSTKKYSLDTVKKFKSCLIQLFNDAVYYDYCRKSPCHNLTIPQSSYNVSDDEDDRIYTFEQMQLIKTYALSHRFGLDVIILIETGMRRSEMLALCWDNVDLENKFIRIKQAAALVVDETTNILTTKIGPPKNKSSKRIIPISTEFANYLKKVKETASSEFVVHNKFNNIINPRTWQRRHYDVFMDDMHNAYYENGIDIPKYTPHRLRHSVASYLVNSNKSLYAISKMLGHSDLDMLRQRYAHTNIEELRNLLCIT